MAKSRFRFVSALPITLVGAALILAAGCGSGSSGTGMGGGGGHGGAGGKGGSGIAGSGPGGSSVAGASGLGGSSVAGTSGTGEGGSSVAGASGLGGSSVAGTSGTGEGGSSVAGASGLGGSSVAGTSGTGEGGSAGGAAGSSAGAGGAAGNGNAGAGGGNAGAGGGNAGAGGGNAGAGGGNAGAGGGNAGAGGAGGAAGAGGQPHDAGTDAGEHKDADTDAKDGEADMGPPACTNACTLGTHRCAGGGSETCGMGSNGCTEWSSASICAGVTTCSVATGLCACPTAPAGCTAAGKFCNSAGDLVTCTQDQQGCFAASAPTVCPADTSCKGTLPSAACSCDNNASCNGGNSFCLSPSVVATCGFDTNTPACNVVSSTSTCGGSSACVAGACVCPAAGTTAGTGCTTLNATTCAGNDILTCVTETSSGCSIWQASTHCGAGGLTCGTKASTTPACQCPENAGTDVFVDPAAGSDVVGGVFPTGIQSPAACRYASLTNGLTKVGSPGRVVAISASLPVAFGGETFPLTIPDGVTVMTADAQPNTTDYAIDFAGGASSTYAVALGKGATLQGFTVDSTGTATGIVSCAVTGQALLDTVSLIGNGSVTDGIDLTGGCAATLHNVTVANVTAAGISVAVSTGVTVNITGSTVSAALGGLLFKSGTVVADDLHTDGNFEFGVVLPPSSSGNPALSLSDSTASGNGIAGDFPGIWIGKGTLTATNINVNANGGAGIQLDSSDAQQITTANVEGNGTKTFSSIGLAQTAGTLTASGVLASSNTDAGVGISGGTATLTGCDLSQNTGAGLLVSNAGTMVTVAGGDINKNGGGGAVASGGTLNLGGNTEVATNGGHGLSLTGASVTVGGANVHDNTGSGAMVSSTNAALIALGSSSTTTTFSHNGVDGILVEASPQTGGGANSITIDTVTAANNGKFGIYIEGDNGNVAATIKGSTITGNADVGLMVEQGFGHTTSEAIQNNDVNGNNTGNGHVVGGVLFNTSSTLTSFIGNKVHSNTGDELGFNDVPNGSTQWVINPPSATCDATANSIYCYGGGNVGLHVLSSSASVNGQHVHWSNNPPTSGIDISGAVTLTNPCTAIATCP